MSAGVPGTNWDLEPDEDDGVIRVERDGVEKTVTPEMAREIATLAEERARATGEWNKQVKDWVTRLRASADVVEN